MQSTGSGLGKARRKVEYAAPSDFTVKDKLPEIPTKPRNVVVFVAKMYGVPPDCVVGSCRKRQHVAARMTAVWIMYKCMGMSHPEIARAMKLSTHTTSINLYRAFESWINSECVVIHLPRLSTSMMLPEPAED